MFSDYNFAAMKVSIISDADMIMKYASLGYFHYQYIKDLDPMNSSENLIKDNGVLRQAASQFKDGSYIEVNFVDFNRKKKQTCLFVFQHHRLRIEVGDLIAICDYIKSSSKSDDSNCFVKFDVYTIAR